MKDIKDYLPYYIGQEIATKEERYNSPGLKLIGICDMGCQLSDEAIKLTYYVNPEHCKLRLRPLSDMMDDEKRAIYKLIFGKEYKGEIQFYSDRTTLQEPRWLLWQGVDRVGIQLNGQIWADCDLHPYKFNQHEITHYLLKQGFWLFGDDWFKEGLIIDKTKTVTNE